MSEKILLRNENGNIIRKHQTKKWTFDNIQNNKSYQYSLFFTCEDASYSAIKHEGNGEKLYLYIDESLNTEKAENSRFCLDMSCGKPKNFPKRALKKIMWQPLKYGDVAFSMLSPYCDNWKAGIFAKADNLRIHKDGYLRFRIDRYEKIPGQDPHFTRDNPVQTDIINIKEGTYDYSCFEKKLIIDENGTACVIITVEGENYSGNVYFEMPHLTSQSGYNVLPDFDTSLCGMNKFAWMGQNLSKREWPYLQVKINGKIFFDGEVFLHIHRFTPIEIDLPQDMVKNGTNEITVTYLSDYHDTVPLVFNEAYVLKSEYSDFKVISCPDIINQDENLRICAETFKDNISFEFESDDFTLESQKNIARKGIHVILLKPNKMKNNLTFCIGTENLLHEYSVERFVSKKEDRVICGSGDLIYTNVANLEDTKRYLRWYLSEKIGNLLTVRQVYRWGGQRYVNPEIWEFLTKLLDEAGIYYVHLSDGRDIPSLAENPTEKMLKGKNFLGRQLHERDGQLFYWREDSGMPMELEAPMEEFYDLVLRLSDERPENIEGAYRKFNVSYKNGQYSYTRNTDCKADMKDAHDTASMHIKRLGEDHFTRHTGPSVMFKYFYECGFEFLGAETMDGSTESLLAFLRGASKAYGKNRYGVHHALQWATFPHDTPGHLRRYTLALLISYMQGVTDINTEEGLWFQEGYYSYHNRLSDTCMNHKAVHQKFYRYIKTHSRTGRFYTRTAFLHGRADGWNGFASARVWGMPFMDMGSDGKSWEMLKIFYPLNRVDKTGMSICRHIDISNDKPVGFFSGTPNGNVDVVPIEKGKFDEYSLLIFAGYNLAFTEDLDNLYEAIRRGATVLCAWPHLSDTTLRSDIENKNFTIINHPLTNCLSEGKAIFETKQINKEAVRMCTNIPENSRVLKYTDKKDPLVYSVNIGKGKIVLLNSLCYPGEACVCDVYKDLIISLYEADAKRDECRIICGEDVEYTQYIQDDKTMHYYLTAVDWYNESEKPRTAQIVIEHAKYTVNLQFAAITKLVYSNKTAAWTDDAESEIISITDKEIIVQGKGKATIHVINGCEKIIEADFSQECVQRILLSEVYNS